VYILHNDRAIGYFACGGVAIDKTLVLLLDTYEVTGAFLDQWVRFSLLRGFANVAGRSVWRVGTIA
jgi:hypothetical protein